jgi:hypothetical protein
MSNIPDKRTTIAAVLYGLAPQKTVETRKGKQTLPWSALSANDQMPFIAASEYLSGQVFGVDLLTVDRAKLAANFEKQKLIEANANEAVSVFVSVVSVLP